MRYRSFIALLHLMNCNGKSSLVTVEVDYCWFYKSQPFCVEATWPSQYITVASNSEIWIAHALNEKYNKYSCCCKARMSLSIHKILIAPERTDVVTGNRKFLMLFIVIWGSHYLIIWPLLKCQHTALLQSYCPLMF